MRVIVFALAAGMGLASVPHAAQAQNRARELERREIAIREARRQEEQARQRRQRLEREAEVLRRAREDRGGVDDRIADIILGRRDGDIYRDSDIYYSRDVRAKRGNGPPFCRSGQGHPVHGRQWCRDKGWRLGDARIDRVDRRDRVILSDRDVVLSDRDRDRDRERDRERDRSVQERVGDIMRGRTR